MICLAHCLAPNKVSATGGDNSSSRISNKSSNAGVVILGISN